MKMDISRRLSVLALAVCVSPAFTQTKIDLRTQTKSVDFSGATATKPARVGTSLPATCGQGEFFFLTNAPAGQNVYGCSTANAWSLQGAAVAQSSLVPTSLNNTGKLLTSDGTNPVWQSLGGDVGGALSALTVTGLNGKKLSTATPTDGQLLKFNGVSGQWEAAALSGDVSGAPVNLRVGALQGRALSSTAPVDGQLMKFNGITNVWEAVALNGDVNGAPDTLRVTALQGRDLSTAAPADGQLLKWNGTTSVWEAVALNGDVTGTPGALRVGALQGRALATAAPANGQLLKFNGTTSTWEPVALAGDVSGAPASLTVSALQGRVVSPAAPSTGQTLAWSGASTAWTPTTVQVPTNFGVTFTAATTVSVLGTQHNLNTTNLNVSCYDGATPANQIEPNRVTVDPVTYNVAITFAAAQTGRCVVNGAGGVGMGATALAGTGTFAFPAVANGSCSLDQTLSVPGALLNNGVAAGWPSLPAGFIGMMRVSANDTVAVRICNFSGASAAVATLTYTAIIVRQF